jgi:hypothetical protein
LISAATLALSVAGTAAAQTRADQILEANRLATGGDAWRGKGAVELKYTLSGQGLTGDSSTVYDLDAPSFIDSQTLAGQRNATGYDGSRIWLQEPSGMVTPQGGGDSIPLAVSEAYQDMNLWWRPGRGGAEITQLPAQTDAGAAFDVLHVVPVGGKPFDAWFDAKTHLLARTVEAQGPVTVTTWISDYHPVDGVMIAAKQVIDTGVGEQYRQTETLRSAVFMPAKPASAFAAPPWKPTDSRIDNAAGRTTAPFKLLNNHIYVDVKVNGKGPFLFIFDTGGDDLLTPDTAKALAVASQGSLPGQGAGNNVTDVGLANGVTFQVGDLTLTNQATAVLPFISSAAEGFNEQGMLGFTVFRRYVTVIDYGARTLTFIDPERFQPKDAGVAVPFVFYGHLVEARGAFEGHPGLFDIDSGSRVELTLTKPFVEAEGLVATHPKGVATVDGWGVGGPSRAYVTRGRSLTLGTVRIGDLVAGLATDAHGAFTDPSYQGNVGTKLLKRFVVTIDSDHQVMYLKRLPGPVADTGSYDRAGCWINTSAAGFKIVDVTAAGPAEGAGLKVGDEITAVDGVDAKTIVLSDLRERLRNDPVGTVVKLTVLSGGQSKVVALTLQDQI